MPGKNQGGGRLPPTHTPDPDDPSTSYTVDQVTPANRHTTQKPGEVILVGLFNADLSQLLFTVYIPRTREMPDCVRYLDKLFVFHDTEKQLPEYTEAMVAEGSALNQQKELSDGTS